MKKVRDWLFVLPLLAIFGVGLSPTIFAASRVYNVSSCFVPHVTIGGNETMQHIALTFINHCGHDVDLSNVHIRFKSVSPISYFWPSSLPRHMWPAGGDVVERSSDVSNQYDIYPKLDSNGSRVLLAPNEAFTLNFSGYDFDRFMFLSTLRVWSDVVLHKVISKYKSERRIKRYRVRRPKRYQHRYKRKIYKKRIHKRAHKKIKPKVVIRHKRGLVKVRRIRHHVAHENLFKHKKIATPKPVVKKVAKDTLKIVVVTKPKMEKIQPPKKRIKPVVVIKPKAKESLKVVAKPEVEKVHPKAVVQIKAKVQLKSIISKPKVAKIQQPIVPKKAVAKKIVTPKEIPVKKEIVTKKTMATPKAVATKMIYTPYVDVAAYGGRGINDSEIDAAKAAGVQDITLGFVLAGEDGDCRAAFAGVPHNRLKQIMRKIHEDGFNVRYTFGGLLGTYVVEKCSNADNLALAYQNFIDKYKVHYINFDIESGKEFNGNLNKMRAQALRRIQDRNSKLKIDITLPVLPWVDRSWGKESGGLTSGGLSVVKELLASGVKINKINLLTMDFGSHYTSYDYCTNYGDKHDVCMSAPVIRAAQAVVKQLKDFFPHKTEAGLWNMIGLTPMIGLNDTYYGSREVFYPQDAKKIVAFAKEKGITLLSSWSLARDRECPKAVFYVGPSCSGLAQKQLDFVRIFISQS